MSPALRLLDTALLQTPLPLPAFTHVPAVSQEHHFPGNLDAFPWTINYLILFISLLSLWWWLWLLLLCRLLVFVFVFFAYISLYFLWGPQRQAKRRCQILPELEQQIVLSQYVVLGIESGFSEEQPVLFTTAPSLQPPNLSSKRYDLETLLTKGTHLSHGS